MKSDKRKFQEGAYYSVGIVMLLWIIKLYEHSSKTDLSHFGILPRTLEGSMGIFTSVLIHGDFHHLMSNSFPLLILISGVIYFYNRIASKVIILIYVITGVSVWLMARDAYHLGASGVVYGLVAFLFVSGFLKREPGAIAISLVVTFLYGGMIYGLLPTNPEISYESHIIGSLAGVLTAFIYIKVSVSTPSSKSEDVADIDPYVHSVSSNAKQYNYIYKADKKSNKINYRIDL